MMDSPSTTPASLAVPSLTLINDQGSEVERWELSGKNTFRLGRGNDNDMVLPFSWVSRKHAMVQVEENGVHNLIDLGSSNGTSVNGRRVYTPTRLRSGDMVGIGKTQLVFLQPESASPAVAADDTESAENRTVAFVQKEIVTVLLCDIHGFTRLSEQLGDQAISKLLRLWSDKVTFLVRQHGGMIDKFIGDAVMAMWTGGGDQRCAILSAMGAAQAISRATRALGREWQGTPLDLEVGAALNTGEAILGNIGGSGQHDYTLIGDMVNVTFRLEDMTSREENVDLIIGSATAAYLEEAESCFTARTFTLKGKDTPIRSFVCGFEGLQAYLDKYAR